VAVEVGAGFSKHEDAEAHKGEGEKGANGDEFAEDAFGKDTRHQLRGIGRWRQGRRASGFGEGD